MCLLKLFATTLFYKKYINLTYRWAVEHETTQCQIHSSFSSTLEVPLTRGYALQLILKSITHGCSLFAVIKLSDCQNVKNCKT